MDVALQALGALVFGALFYGTALTALALLVTRALRRRLAPSTAAALWTLALLKFLVPIGPALPARFGGRLAGALPLPAELLSLGAAPAPGAAGARDLPLVEGLIAVWLLCALALCARALLKARELHRALQPLAEAGPELRAKVELHARALGVSPPLVQVGDGAPFVAGLWHTRLVLPAQASGEALEAMIVHELAHLRRRDPLIRALQVAAQLCFFFWPPVWFAQRRLDEAREQACDAVVLGRVAIAPRDYARLLIDLQRQVQAMPGSSLAMAAHVSQLEGRIDMLMESKVRRAGPLATAAVAGFALLAVGLGVHAEAPAKADTDAAATKLIVSAIAKFQAGDAPGAIKDFTGCVDLAPSAPVLGRCYKNLGVVWAKNKDTKKAKEYLLLYLPLAPPDERDRIKAMIEKFGK